MKKDRTFNPPWQHIKKQFAWSWWALFYVYRNTEPESFLVEKNQGADFLAASLQWDLE